MAYELLSLLLGDLVYDRRLDFIRQFIKEGTKTNKLLIENLTSENYDPLHVIYPELSGTEVIINIILFRWLVYRVLIKAYIKDFNVQTSDFVYVEDLKNRNTLMAESVNEYKQGIFIKY